MRDAPPTQGTAGQRATPQGAFRPASLSIFLQRGAAFPYPCKLSTLHTGSALPASAGTFHFPICSKIPPLLTAARLPPPMWPPYLDSVRFYRSSDKAPTCFNRATSGWHEWARLNLSSVKAAICGTPTTARDALTLSSSHPLFRIPASGC